MVAAHGVTPGGIHVAQEGAWREEGGGDGGRRGDGGRGLTSISQVKSQEEVRSTCVHAGCECGGSSLNQR